MQTMSPAQTHQKAKSRLAHSEPVEQVESSTEPDSKLLTFASAGAAKSPVDHTRKVTHDTSSSLDFLRSFWSTRLRYLLLLFLGILGYAGCIYIFRMVQPESIANILFYHSYLPLLIVSFCAHFFFWSFIFLHSRRAFFVAIVLTTLLFFKLQAVILTTPLLIGIIGAAVLLELAIFFIFKK